MSIYDSITQARQQGASDDDILNEIIRQNPQKSAVFSQARQMGANSSDILNETLRQNQGTVNPTSIPQTQEEPTGSFYQRNIVEPLKGFSTGVAKGELSTLKGLGSLGTQLVDQTAGRVTNLLQGKG